MVWRKRNGCRDGKIQLPTVLGWQIINYVGLPDQESENSYGWRVRPSCLPSPLSGPSSLLSVGCEKLNLIQLVPLLNVYLFSESLFSPFFCPVFSAWFCCTLSHTTGRSRVEAHGMVTLKEAKLPEEENYFKRCCRQGAEVKNTDAGKR